MLVAVKSGFLPCKGDDDVRASSLGIGRLWRKPTEKSQVLSLPGTQLTEELEWQHLGRWCRAGNIWLVSGVSYGNVRREDSEIVMVGPITEYYCPPGPCVRATTVRLGLSPGKRTENRITALCDLLMWTSCIKNSCTLFFQWQLSGRDRSSNVYTVISNSALSSPLLPIPTETVKHQENSLLVSVLLQSDCV